MPKEVPRVRHSLGALVRAHRKARGPRKTIVREAGQPVSLAPGCPVSRASEWSFRARVDVLRTDQFAF